MPDDFHSLPTDDVDLLVDPCVEPARLSAAELAALVTWSELLR